MFARKGVITLNTNQIDEDTLLELVLEAGGDDVKTEADVYEIVTAPEAFEDVRSALEQKALTLDVAEVTMMPQNTVPVEGKQAEQVLRLMEALDDQDDVRKAHANSTSPTRLWPLWHRKSLMVASLQSLPLGEG